MTAVEERVWTMGDYVDESPAVLRDNLARFEELTDPLMGLCGDRMPKRIRLVASGSSYNACQCAHPFMSACLPCVDVPAGDPAPLLLLRERSRSRRAAARGDAKRPFHQCPGGARCHTGPRRSGRLPHRGRGGRCARSMPYLTVDWGAGVEPVGYVTKVVSTLALFLMMFACRLGGRLNRLPELGRAVDVLDAVARRPIRSSSAMRRR